MNAIKAKREELENAIEFLMIRIAAKEFKAKPPKEKLEYINEAISLFSELKDYVGLFDRMKIKGMVVTLEIAKSDLEKEAKK